MEVTLPMDRVGKAPGCDCLRWKSDIERDRNLKESTGLLEQRRSTCRRTV